MKTIPLLAGALIAGAMSLPAQAHGSNVSGQLLFGHGPLLFGLSLDPHRWHGHRHHGYQSYHRNHGGHAPPYRDNSHRHDRRHDYGHDRHHDQFRGQHRDHDRGRHRGHSKPASHRHTHANICYLAYPRGHAHWR